MRIKIQQFLFGKNHSWSVVGQNLGRALMKLGHDLEFVSTDGFEDKYCPDDLRPFAKKEPSGTYDCQISYTAPHNWPGYLANGNKNRLAIWNYEYNGKNLLQGFAKHYKQTTKVLPSSYFTKEVFLNMKIPEEHMVVVPHGINLEDFEDGEKCAIQTKKKHKILLNIAQPHRRKAIPLALEGFGKAFTKDDDVCLVAKVFTKNKGKHQFDVDFPAMYKTFERKFSNHAEVEFQTSYIQNIAHIYNACNINYSATHAECWHLPSLEALAAGLINVVPNYGGQLDFCNDKNSLLIDGKIVRAPRDHQYWHFNQFAVHYSIDTNNAAQQLQKAVEEYDDLLEKFSPYMKSTAAKFTWENAAQMILDLCEK
jgi:glycosyltransferase involved in cell wall biosynthesis